jgi:hypothetical protein
LRAAVLIASASASDTCPASSMISVSTTPSSRVSANSHAVPAKSSVSSPAAVNASVLSALLMESLS